MTTPSLKQRQAIQELTLFGILYVVLGVPACTAVVLFILGVFFTLLLGGGSFDLTGMQFWTGVAFLVGPIMILTIALRARARVLRGEPSFLSPGLSRMVPVLMGLGVLGALGFGGYARYIYTLQVESAADSFCWTWDHKREVSEEACEDAARDCFRSRPIDEDTGSNRYRNAMAACMETWFQAQPRP